MSQTSLAPATSPSRGRNITAWILAIVLAAAYLAAGGAKLAGVPMMIQTFDQIGLGQWFRIVTGLVEAAGALALLAPGYAFFGAVLLAVTMVGAVLTHLLVLSTPAAPAVLLLALDAALAWLRRDQITWFVAPRR
jgi:putative oxidoreductase